MKFFARPVAMGISWTCLKLLTGRLDGMTQVIVFEGRWLPVIDSAQWCFRPPSICRCSDALFSSLLLPGSSVVHEDCEGNNLDEVES
jgi:hypothetical protein